MEINSGVKKILTKPFIYNLFGKVISRGKTEQRYANELILNKPCNRVLDCGCGTANVLNFLPGNIEYVGIDLSKAYIQRARERYKDRGRFYCLNVNDLPKLELEPFDCIFLKGLIHHLDDIETENLFVNLKKLLSSNGRVVTLDGCFLKKQHPISRFLLKKDRGQNVRYVEEYVKLAKKVFSNVKFSLLSNHLRVPYDLIVMELS